MNKYQAIEDKDEEGEDTVECVEYYVRAKNESEVCKECASTDHWHDMPKLISSGEEDVGRDWKHIKQKKKKKGRRVWINLVEGDEEKVKKEKICMNLRFQVADVKKPLMSVKRIVEKGNNAGFGPKNEDNYMLNEVSGNNMILKPNGRGSYLMNVQFVGGGKAEITADSAAEEEYVLGSGESNLGRKKHRICLI